MLLKNKYWIPFWKQGKLEKILNFEFRFQTVKNINSIKRFLFQ